MTKHIPCTCGNYRPGEPFVRGRDCPKCWRIANPLTIFDVKKCIYIGDEIPPGKIKALGSTRKWFICLANVNDGEVTICHHCKVCTLKNVVPVDADTIT